MTMVSMTEGDLTEKEHDLLQVALGVAGRALNPVSRFHVGAAVRAANTRIYRGTFFESSSFPLGICAESAALSAAITDGVREFEAVAVVGGDPESTLSARPVTPCGGCRQRIFDVTGGTARNVPVLCSNLKLSTIYRFSISDLLPYPFSVDDLPTSVSPDPGRTRSPVRGSG
ncbi:cytidine deaminase [Streptomyces sp. NPDC093272]|uniref:cytidine deaminase n=1 Tax=Streptomyces sp. NPDC093272 TaxID=3154981 RepID=UPI003436D27C